MADRIPRNVATVPSVEIRQNPRAKRLTLRIDKHNAVPVLTVPTGISMGQIQSFLETHKDWIADRVAALPEGIRLVPDAAFPFRGIPHIIRHEAGFSREPLACEGEVRLGGPMDHVERRMLRWLRRCARTRLVERATYHAQSLGVSIGRISVRDTKSRWGSCTTTGNLNFSWRLILAPDDILDYVAAHEVAHRVEMNHSPRFWAEVDRLCANRSAARQWLRRHGDGLMRVGPPPGGESAAD